jgi:hypothetical protein
MHWKERTSEKTQLAMDIIRTPDSLREGAGEAELASITGILLRTSHNNRREISEAEERIKAKLER